MIGISIHKRDLLNIKQKNQDPSPKFCAINANERETNIE